MSREISDDQEGEYYELSTEPTGTLSISGLEKIEPISGIIIESRWSPPSPSEFTAKLNEVIEKLNLVMDYLNKGVKSWNGTGW